MLMLNIKYHRWNMFVCKWAWAQVSKCLILKKNWKQDKQRLKWTGLDLKAGQPCLQLSSMSALSPTELSTPHLSSDNKAHFTVEEKHSNKSRQTHTHTHIYLITLFCVSASFTEENFLFVCLTLYLYVSVPHY